MEFPPLSFIIYRFFTICGLTLQTWSFCWFCLLPLYNCRWVYMEREKDRYKLWFLFLLLIVDPTVLFYIILDYVIQYVLHVSHILMKMYLVLSQVEHQTIECHRKNITIVYLFGLSVVSLSYCYKPGRPPLPASLACPGRPPLADLPYLLTHLPWHRLPLTLPWQTSPADLPWHRPPLTLPWQTSPAWQTSLSLTHLPGWARKN